MIKCYQPLVSTEVSKIPVSMQIAAKSDFHFLSTIRVGFMAKTAESLKL